MRFCSVGIATELQAGRSGDRIPVGARFCSVGIATELQAGRSGDRIPVGGEILLSRYSD